MDNEIKEMIAKVQTYSATKSFEQHIDEILRAASAFNDKLAALLKSKDENSVELKEILIANGLMQGFIDGSNVERN